MNKFIKKSIELMADIQKINKGLTPILAAASINSKWAAKLGIALSVTDFISDQYNDYLYSQICKPKLLLSDDEKYFNFAGPINWRTNSPILNIDYFLFSLFKTK